MDDRYGRPLFAESNGQSNAIEGSIAAMLKLTVPVISVITGEGVSIF